MEVKTIDRQDFTVLAIKHDNISPSLLCDFSFPEISGGGLVIDGAKPSWLISHLACKYKNLFTWIAVSVPATKEAIVVWSREVQGDYTMGNTFPFELAAIAAG